LADQVSEARSCERPGGGPVMPSGAPFREEQSIRELIRRVARRDQQAFERVYRDFSGRLLAYLRRVLRDPQLVEECVNDTMVVVWQRADRFRPEKRLSSWIFGIAQKKALKKLEAQRRRRDVPSGETDDPILENIAGSSETEQTAARREQLALLKTAIEQLSPEQRDVIELAFGAGNSYAEIAEALQIPVNTVKTRMFHARKRLRSSIGEGW